MSGYCAIDALRKVMDALDDFEAEVEATTDEEYTLNVFRRDLVRACKPMIRRCHSDYENKMLDDQLLRLE
jgi:hypothetical protein